MCVRFEVMGAALWWNRLCYPVPQWWAGMWQAANSYGVEPESLSSGLPQSPGSDPFNPTLPHPDSLSLSHSPTTHTPILSSSLIWTIRAKTGEASRAHPTSFLSFSVMYFQTPSLHPSISLASHADHIYCRSSPSSLSFLIHNKW